jgi:hypothetical protein
MAQVLFNKPLDMNHKHMTIKLKVSLLVDSIMVPFRRIHSFNVIMSLGVEKSSTVTSLQDSTLQLSGNKFQRTCQGPLVMPDLILRDYS